MLPFISAFMAVVALRCPHCGVEQARSRREDPLSCKGCRRTFSQKDGRHALKDAPKRRPL